MSERAPSSAAARGAIVLAAALALAATPVSAQLQWEERAPVRQPSPRAGHSMAYDSARGVTVLFGGMDPTGADLAETWIYDGTIWTQLFPATSPPARFFASMAYDEVRGRVVLFGGLSAASGLLQDTWEWDGAVWIPFSPPASPAPRAEAGLVFDSGRGATVLFGGNFYGKPFSFFAETWEWDGANWTQRRTTNSPPARSAFAFAYDSVRGRAVLHGGMGGVEVVRLLSDTWEFDGLDWREIAPLASPGARAHHAMAFFPQIGVSALFGESSGGLGAPDTWEWDGSSWREVSTLARPATRNQHAMAFDSARGRAVLFGGSTHFGIVGATWELFLTPVYVRVVRPAEGSEGGGDAVRIEGGGFTSAADTVVFFGPNVATVVDVAPGLVRVRTPIGTGTVDVVVRNSNGDSPRTARFGYVAPEIHARRGNVNVATGDVADVLFLNGSAGDPATRLLDVAVSAPLSIDVVSAPSRAVSPFALYLWRRLPAALTLVDLPFGIGRMVLPAPASGGSPQPLIVWKNIAGHERILGAATRPSNAAPSNVLALPSGVPRALDFTIQALIRDDASQIPQGVSVTNAILVRVR